MSISEKLNVKKLLTDTLEKMHLGGFSGEIIAREIDFLEELLRWNKKINLTAITSPNEALEKHLVDSMMLLPWVEKLERVIDVGSGGGLPVIPLAIAVPQVQFVSVESVAKKTHFQKHIKRMLGLNNLQIHCTRIEQLYGQEGFCRFDLVTARALAPLKDLLLPAMELLRPGGALLAMKGPEAGNEVLTARSSWPEGLEAQVEMHDYRLPITGAERTLIRIGKKRKL